MSTKLETSIEISTEEQKLTQDYIYLMGELHKVLAVTKPTQKDEFLVNEWKNKFTNDFFARIDASRTRNIYLAKFIECLRTKNLSGPFCMLPPIDDLPELNKKKFSSFGLSEWVKTKILL